MKLLIGLSLLAMLMSGCSGGSDEPVTPEQDATGRYVVEMVGQKFDPPHIKVPVNSTVVWENTSDSPHDVSSENGDFDSDDEVGVKLQKGMEYTHTFSETGKFTYFCELHKSQRMVGSVTVE